MSKRRRGYYHQVVEGEWVQPAMRGFEHQCCHCALVHTTDYRIVDGRVQFRVRINRRRTAALRRNFNFTRED